MISVFKKNDVLNIFLLLPYTILLRIYSLFTPTAYEITEVDTVLSQWIFTSINNPLTQSIIAIVLIFAQAILINLLVNNHRLHRLPSALTGMFYIFFVSCMPEFQQLSPALIGATFLLIAIFNIFKTYKLTIAASPIFNAALASAMAAILYAPFLFAIVAIFIGLATMRNFKIKERFQFIIGYGVLLWITGALLYFFDLLDWSLLSLLEVPGTIRSITLSTPPSIWTISIVALLILISLGNYYNFMKKKGIDIRKKIDFFYWLLLCSLLAIVLFEGLGFQHFHFLAISLSLFFSMAISLIRNGALAELLHLSLLIAVFYYQFA